MKQKIYFRQGIFLLTLVLFFSFLIENANAYNIEDNGVCTCSSCSDCTDALNDNTCSNVKLTTDIINYSGTCIDNPENFNNKIFDCQGHKIDGNKSSWSYGIYLYNKQNNTIRKCIITDFDYYGIFLEFSSNNTITWNNASSNNIGIYLSSSSNNTITWNNASSNKIGIYLYYSSNNTLINNTASLNSYGIYIGWNSNNDSMISNKLCYNFKYDIYNDRSSTAGNNNTCVAFYNYNDINSTGCSNVCPLNENGCNCSSCEECNYKLSHPSCSQVNLTADIINHSGTCIDNPANFNNKIFDCQGHKIDGSNNWRSYGIYLGEKQNNTIRNCIITDFDFGIYLDSSSNNTLTGNNATLNKIGIFSQKSNSIINSNFVCGNINYDFYSSNWLSSYGDNNTCGNPDGWNDKGTKGCTYSCNCTQYDLDGNNFVDIFDVVAGLEYLSYGKEIYNKECTARNKEIDLFDLLRIMERLI
ncbi:MAG: nitrous oxide reductase family maturation protein NosD [Candidatus Altarchaeaceae archaeon]